MAALIMFTAKCRNPRLFFQMQPGSMDKHDFIDLLKDIKIEMKGKKLLLIWDRLPAHRAKAVADHIKSESSWLRVEHYPAYAPELSPVEFMWSAMKGKDLAQIPPKGLKHLKRMVRKSVTRMRSNTSLLKGFLKKAGVLS